LGFAGAGLAAHEQWALGGQGGFDRADGTVVEFVAALGETGAAAQIGDVSLDGATRFNVDDLTVAGDVDLFNSADVFADTVTLTGVTASIEVNSGSSIQVSDALTAPTVAAGDGGSVEAITIETDLLDMNGSVQ